MSIAESRRRRLARGRIETEGGTTYRTPTTTRRPAFGFGHGATISSNSQTYIPRRRVIMRPQGSAPAGNVPSNAPPAAGGGQQDMRSNVQPTPMPRATAAGQQIAGVPSAFPLPNAPTRLSDINIAPTPAQTELDRLLQSGSTPTPVQGAKRNFAVEQAERTARTLAEAEKRAKATPAQPTMSDEEQKTWKYYQARRARAAARDPNAPITEEVRREKYWEEVALIEQRWDQDAAIAQKKHAKTTDADLVAQFRAEMAAGTKAEGGKGYISYLQHEIRRRQAEREKQGLPSLDEEFPSTATTAPVAEALPSISQWEQMTQEQRRAQDAATFAAGPTPENTVVSAIPQFGSTQPPAPVPTTAQVPDSQLTTRARLENPMPLAKDERFLQETETPAIAARRRVMEERATAEQVGNGTGYRVPTVTPFTTEGTIATQLKDARMDRLTRPSGVGRAWTPEEERFSRDEADAYTQKSMESMSPEQRSQAAAYLETKARRGDTTPTFIGRRAFLDGSAQAQQAAQAPPVSGAPGAPATPTVPGTPAPGTPGAVPPTQGAPTAEGDPGRPTLRQLAPVETIDTNTFAPEYGAGLNELATLRADYDTEEGEDGKKINKARQDEIVKYFEDYIYSLTKAQGKKLRMTPEMVAHLKAVYQPDFDSLSMKERLKAETDLKKKARELGLQW